MSWLDSYYQVYFSLMKDKFIIDITNDFGGAPGLPGGGAPDHFGMPGGGAPPPPPNFAPLAVGVDSQGVSK